MSEDLSIGGEGMTDEDMAAILAQHPQARTVDSLTPGEKADVDQNVKLMRDFWALITTLQQNHIAEIHGGDESDCRMPCLSSKLQLLVMQLDVGFLKTAIYTVAHDAAVQASRAVRGA